MRRLFRPAAGVALAALVLSAPSAGAETKCTRWRLEVTCEVTPTKMVLGEPFSAVLTAKNAGDVALTEVTLQLRADAGAPCLSGPGAGIQTLVEKLDPGASKALTAKFLPEAAGTARVLGSGRDGLGWAVGNCACTVEVVGYPALKARIESVDAEGKAAEAFATGKTYGYVVEVANEGATEATSESVLVLSLPRESEFVSGKATGDLAVTGSGRTAKSATFRLTPENPKRRFEFTVKAVAPSPGARVRAIATLATTTGVVLAREGTLVSIE